MSNQPGYMSEKEHNEQTGAPVLAITQSVLAISIVFFVPVSMLFWVAVALPFYAVFNYIATWVKTKNAGSLTMHDKASEYRRRKVFLGLSFLGSIVCTVVIAGLLFLLEMPVLSWEYVVAVALALFLFSIGLVFWTFSKTNAMIARSVATKPITYTQALKSAVYAVLTQYVVTQFIIGDNTAISVAIISVVTIPYILWLRASVLYNLLGYHPSDMW